MKDSNKLGIIPHQSRMKTGNKTQMLAALAALLFGPAPKGSRASTIIGPPVVSMPMRVNRARPGWRKERAQRRWKTLDRRQRANRRSV
jgi:hypothetical protein